MPAELKDHLRYPEDLFRVQTEVYSKYQIPAEDFFQRAGAWSVAQAPSIDRQDANLTPSRGLQTRQRGGRPNVHSESATERFIPYYTMFRNALTGEEEFVILRPFVPFSTDDRRTELQAYMTASGDGGNYGQLITYVVTNNPLPSGPARVADQAETEQEISPVLSLQSNTETGTRVRFGDLQLFPVAGGLIYVRPVFVATDAVTEYRFVIVSHEGSAVLAEDLDTALADLFPGFDGDLCRAKRPLFRGPTTPGGRAHRRRDLAVAGSRSGVRRGPSGPRRGRPRGVQAAIDGWVKLLDQAAATIDEEGTGETADTTATTEPRRCLPIRSLRLPLRSAGGRRFSPDACSTVWRSWLNAQFRSGVSGYAGIRHVWQSPTMIACRLSCSTLAAEIVKSLPCCSASRSTVRSC